MVFLTGLNLLGRRLSRRMKREMFEASKWEHPLYSADMTPESGRMKGLMKGMYPVTRTREYLGQGITFRDCVKVMTVNYGTYESSASSHGGIREVINMNIPQMRYMNPDVHIELLENITPTPYITFYLENGEKFYVDVDGQNQFEILTHLQKIIGKPRELIEQETAQVKENPANFGRNFTRTCMCFVQGQVPCSSVAPETPGYTKALKGKQINKNPKKNPFGEED